MVELTTSVCVYFTVNAGGEGSRGVNTEGRCLQCFVLNLRLHSVWSLRALESYKSPNCKACGAVEGLVCEQGMTNVRSKHSLQMRRCIDVERI